MAIKTSMKLPYQCLSDEIWLYKASSDNKARYVLGRLKHDYKNPLICIGINPSYAEPGFLDPTLTIVNRVAEEHNYDGWIMLNVYPEKNPKWERLLPKDSHYHSENRHSINEILSAILRQRDGVDVWCAWGATVDKNTTYLKGCLQNIWGLFDKRKEQVRCRCIGTVAKKGIEHPGHPNPYRPNDIKKLVAFKMYGKGGYAEKYLLNDGKQKEKKV